jgi:serine/threonine-protein kinase RsbW
MSVAPDQSGQGKTDLIHERDQIDRVVREVLDALTRLGYVDSSRFAVRLAMEEAISNAFRHGHKDLPHTTPIHLAWRASDAELLVAVEDRGPGFDPTAVPDPTLDQNLEIPSGRGLMLMRAYMSSVSFNKAGNKVTMTYRKPSVKP